MSAETLSGGGAQGFSAGVSAAPAAPSFEAGPSVLQPSISTSFEASPSFPAPSPSINKMGISGGSNIPENLGSMPKLDSFNMGFEDRRMPDFDFQAKSDYAILFQAGENEMGKPTQGFEPPFETKTKGIAFIEIPSPKKSLTHDVVAGALNDFASRNIMNERSDPDPVRTDDHGIVVWSKDKKAGTLNIETNVPLIAKEPELLDREIDLAGFHKFQDIATTETLDNTDPISIVEAHTKSEKVPDLVLDAKTQNLIDLYLSRYSVQNAPSNVKLQEEDLKLPEQQNEVKSIQEQEVVEVEDVYPALHVSEESEAHSAKTDKNEKIDPLVKEKVREDFKQAAKVLGLMEEITQNKQESFARVSRVLDKKFEQDGIEPVVVIRSYVHTAVPEIRSSTIQVPEVDIRVKTQPATFGQVKEVLQEENQPQEKTQEKTLVLPATRVQEDEKVKEEIVVDEEEDEEEEKTKKRPRKINKKVYAKDTGTDKNRMETIVSLAKKALEARPGVDKKIPGQDLDLPGHPPPPELKSEMVRDDPSYPDGSYTKIVEKVTSIGEIRSEDIEYLAFKLVHDNPAVKVETGENNEVPDEAVKTVLDKKRVNKKEK